MRDIIEAHIQQIQARLITWGQANFADFPWRYTGNRWHALVAEIMLQRTNADQVVPVYEDFCIRYPTPAAYAAADSPDTFQNLGLKWRQPLLEELARTLTGTRIPQEKKALLQLPGVGDYIAAAFLSLHVGRRAVIIDSNVVRIYGRLFGFPTHGETRRKKWFVALAERMTPADDFRAYNYSLIDFTRAICRPKPLCADCPLLALCDYGQQNQPGAASLEVRET